MDLFKESIAFGLTPFETIYFENKECRLLESHYFRLKRSLRIFNIPFNISFSEFKFNINSYIKEQNDAMGILKVIFLDNKFHYKIRKPSYTKIGFENGMRLCISNVKRDNKNILTYTKTLNYGVNIIEDKRAKKKGFDGCLFLNSNLELCETSFANIFFRKGNTIITPSVVCGLLPGTMRKNIIKWSRENGFNIKKEKIVLNELKDFDEAFISNAAIGAYPIKSINNIEFLSRDFVNRICSEKDFLRNWN